ncbi:hypothetical protein Scep_020094 [Stephania cephalantha]|uniref:Uncharacterized protein n=1 Tax=Stephania cephalantha TaxID=152367 RepID=A0AAP0ICF6_9MAGN
MRNIKHEGIQDLAPSNLDVLQSDSELRILSNLGVQSSPNPDQMANLLSTPVLWIQASPFVLSRKAPDPPNSAVSELIQIIGDLDLVASRCRRSWVFNGSSACGGVQLPNPPDLTLLADNLSFCCTTVGLPPWPPPPLPNSPPSVFFILDSTYLCLGDTSMSYTSSLVIVASQLGKMTMIERHASRGDGVVLITAQHSRYFSSISKLDNLVFKRQTHMNKASFEDHLQTSTLPTHLVGSINYRDDILAFLVAFHLVTPSCLKEARAAVVCVGRDGSGTYIDVAFQAFGDMLLRVLECLTALVLHTKMKFWTKLAGCLALMGTMQFGGTFGSTRWMMHLALSCTIASLGSSLAFGSLILLTCEIMRWIWILAWSPTFVFSHIFLIGFMTITYFV